MLATATLFLLFIHSTSAISGQIYNSNSSCRKSQFGARYECYSFPSEKQSTFVPDEISSTTSEAINSLNVTNEITYHFQCFSTKRFQASLKFKERTYELGWNTKTSFLNTIAKSELGELYSLHLAPNKGASVKNCTIDIISNISTIDSSALSFYKKALEQVALTLSITQNSLDPDSVYLDAKNALNYGKSLFSFVTASSADPILKSQITTLEKEFDKLLSNLSFSCGEDTRASYCTEYIARARQKINEIIDQNAIELRDFNKFISKEKSRLRSLTRKTNFISTYLNQLDSM